MSMKAIQFSGLALIGILISSGYANAEERLESNRFAPLIANVGPLKLKLVVEQFMGQNMLDAVLENPSDEFFCINSSVLDSTYQHIRLKDKSGKEVPLLSYGEMWPRALLGFDYNVPYLFIVPNETRTVDANIKNFKISPGKYTYDVVFSYYLCRDVIDTDRLEQKNQIETFTNEVTGSITLEAEKPFGTYNDKSKARKSR